MCEFRYACVVSAHTSLWNFILRTLKFSMSPIIGTVNIRHRISVLVLIKARYLQCVHHDMCDNLNTCANKHV